MMLGYDFSSQCFVIFLNITLPLSLICRICHDTFMLILSNYVREKKIPVNAGWKLVSINTSTKMAWFEDTSGSLNAVDCNLKRILACDGLCSSVKSVMEKESFGFQCETTPWSTEFRMLFSSPNASSGSGGLNTNTQYVINGHYIVSRLLLWDFAVNSFFFLGCDERFHGSNNLDSSIGDSL